MASHDMTLLWHYVDKWAAEKPEAKALVFEDERLSWAQFKEAVDRTAKAFLAAGVQKGDRIGMVSMARNEFIISFMAASKVGAIWLGMSPKFSVDELRYMVLHSEPAVLITLREYQGIDLTQAGMTFSLECPSIQEVLVIGDAIEGTQSYAAFTSEERPELNDALAARAAEVSEDSEVLLMYTSGSTGKPKGVLQTHRAIVENIRQEIHYMGFESDGRVLLHFPINHVAADVEIGFGAIMSGATLVLMDRFDPQASLDVIEKERITLLGQVPVMYLMQFQAPKFGEMDWSSVRTFVWGGSGAPQIMIDVLTQISQKTGARLVTGYGSTELCGFATYTAPEDDAEVLARGVGRVVPPFEVKIVDTERNILPPNETGELAFRGPIVMKGYFKNTAVTASVMDEEGWYYTSDLGYMREDGQIFLKGRSSEMFKSGGENVFPREVEDVLESFEGVLFSAVVGVPDDLYAEVGYAFIMTKPGHFLTEEALRAHARERLANFKVPKKFDIRPILPLLANGKVNKMALKKELGLA